MTFDQFCRALGLIVDRVEVGRWVRVPTVDHPRTRNGAYKFLGDIGWAQNHATQVDVATWRPDESTPNTNREAIAKKAAEFEAKRVQGWERAARRAADLAATATPKPHAYLMNKGFTDTPGLVLQDDVLLIPMNHWKSNRLVGAQLIRWLPEERRFEKKMLPGMRAKGAVFRMGSARAPRTWLVEGFATGLSVEAALRVLRLRDSVTVCFSDGNLVHVASQIATPAIVFSDNDESGAGLRAAERTGLPYCMSPVVGFDANDMHKHEGIFTVASLMLGATQLQREPVS